jgi:hypothetical protein
METFYFSLETYIYISVRKILEKFLFSGPRENLQIFSKARNMREQSHFVVITCIKLMYQKLLTVGGTKAH